MKEVAKRGAAAVVRFMRLLLATLLAPFAVLAMAFLTARKDRKARAEALEPGTLTEVEFSDTRIVALSQSPSGALRVTMEGPVRTTRMGPSGVAEELMEAFEADVPFAPQLMAALVALQEAGLLVDGEMRFVSRPNTRTRSKEVLQMLRISPAGQPEAGLEMTLE